LVVLFHPCKDERAGLSAMKCCARYCCRSVPILFLDSWVPEVAYFLFSCWLCFSYRLCAGGRRSKARDQASQRVQLLCPDQQQENSSVGSLPSLRASHQRGTSTDPPRIPAQCSREDGNHVLKEARSKLPEVGHSFSYCLLYCHIPYVQVTIQLVVEG